jgi:hypothetical protein
MNQKEFHVPFIQSMIIVAVVTVISMVSSHYIINYYAEHSIFTTKNINYSSQESQEQPIPSNVE